MKFQLKKRALTATVIATTAVVIVFAIMQFRWSTEVIEATGVRMADTLQLSMVNWQIDFFRDFSEVGQALRTDARTSDEALADLRRGLDEWRAMTRYPDLVSNVSVQSAEEASVRHLKSTVGTGWRFDPTIPALLYPVNVSPRSASEPRIPNPESRILSPEFPAWIVVELSEAVLRNRILPDLAHRYFQGTDGLDYEVAVVAGTPPRHVIYTSDSGFGEQEVADADGTMNIFGRPVSGSVGPLKVFHKTSESQELVTPAISWFPLVREPPNGGDWQLIVRHRRGGPLGDFVADMHRRDLMISFGALLLLVVSIAMLVVTSTRAQRLATLQMDFVTAVSHELRTPLTVIGSAADNIAQGVVEGQEQLVQYGSVIGNQVTQLSTLVEQILQFAAANKGQQRFSLRPLEVEEIVDATLASTAGLIQAAHFTVERGIEPGLPPVMGDLVALSQCMQNLVTNALKYGRDQRWIGISARVTNTGAGGREIQLSVSDRGIGIDPTDLPHIFEPFYRSPSATAAQIHGTGLGLALAKGIAEAMRGDLTVSSEPGRGSTFTLHLPCAEPVDRPLKADLGTPVAHTS